MAPRLLPGTGSTQEGTNGDGVTTTAYELPADYRNDWEQEMDALIATEGTDVALRKASADSMVWTCAQYGHAKHPDYERCVCGEP